LIDESNLKEKIPDEPSEDIKDKPLAQTPSEKEAEYEDQTDEVKDTEEVAEGFIEEEKSEDISEEITEEKVNDEPVLKDEIKEKGKEPKKPEGKKEKSKKKVDRGPDFKYIVRLSNTDIDGEKNVVYGLTSIKGIGLHMAKLIADKTEIDCYKKIGDLTDAQVDKLQEMINNVNKNAPGWMLNRQKDYETGEDIHLIGSDIDMKLRDEINIMKKIRSYRGIRHERGLRVRGQRTRANNRKGLSLGVSKKRES
jgi:small subunit ribosomal protein S13